MEEEIKPVKKRPVFLIVAMAFFAIAILAGLTIWQMKAGFGGDYNATLFLSAKGINLACPREMGDGVRLDSVAAKRDLQLLYYYTLTTAVKSDSVDVIDCDTYEEAITTNLSGSADMEEFGSHNVTLVFNMNDMNGELLCSVAIPATRYYKSKTK